MNWQDISFDWNHARSFLATLEEGSLSGAARVLGQTQPTLSRQVAALETELGLPLFERVGRSLVPTPAGQELALHIRAMRDAAARVSLSASGQNQNIEGRVRITASDAHSAYLLPPVIMHLRQIAPLLEIELVADNDIRDLQRREADIALRHVRPSEPDLYARLLRDETAHFYASRSYLKRKGTPKTASDFATHDLIHFGDIKQMLGFLIPAGFPVTKDNFRTGSSSSVVAWELAKTGAGLAIMADEIAMLSSDMERLLPDVEPFTFPVWLTTHSELHSSRRIRLVFDTLAEFFQNRS